MYAHNVPYCPAIPAAAQLRIQSAKVYDYAAINFDHGGTYGVDVLVPFWTEVKALADVSSGRPYDGPYLGSGVKDLRPLVYKCLSHVRLYPGDAEDQFKALCDYFITEAGKLVPVVAVTGVTVAPATTSGAPGVTRQIVPTVAPANATNKAVTYSTSTAAVATVSTSGLITFVADGTATITTTTVDGGKTATTAVTVTTPAP